MVLCLTSCPQRLAAAGRRLPLGLAAAGRSWRGPPVAAAGHRPSEAAARLGAAKVLPQPALPALLRQAAPGPGAEWQAPTGTGPAALPKRSKKKVHQAPPLLPFAPPGPGAGPRAAGEAAGPCTALPKRSTSALHLAGPAQGMPARLISEGTNAIAANDLVAVARAMRTT